MEVLVNSSAKEKKKKYTEHEAHNLHSNITLKEKKIAKRYKVPQSIQAKRSKGKQEKMWKIEVKNQSKY